MATNKAIDKLTLTETEIFKQTEVKTKQMMQPFYQSFTLGASSDICPFKLFIM